MLTDIFSKRYLAIQMWDSVGQAEQKLLVQAFRILTEQICLYYTYDGKESKAGKEFWQDVHDRLSMELGIKSLSPLVYQYQTTWNGQPYAHANFWPIHQVCENWMLKPYDGSETADLYMKERLSLVEIAFRKRWEEIESANANLPKEILNSKISLRRPYSGIRIPGDRAEALKSINNELNAKFKSSIDELNARFIEAKCNLTYHTGFIQRRTDALIDHQIESVFWDLVSDQKWRNVDVDMKQAIDLRDTNGRDPAFYACRALESTLKIISDEKGCTHGKEKGAHNYVDNLASKKIRFLDKWEAEAIKFIFSEIRNPFGHGSGNEEMPKLSSQQTDWAIEACMTWIKSMIRRL